MKKIKVAIIGVGNCAKSLVEGVQYYVNNPEDKTGLMYPDIGGYTVNDLEFVVGFDVDCRKVGKYLSYALFAAPNCAMDHVGYDGLWNGDVVAKSAQVFKTPVMDGVAPHMDNYPAEVSFRVDEEQKPMSAFAVTSTLLALEVDVIINYLPVGSEQATVWWMDRALDAGCHFVNCIPTAIASDQAQRIEQFFIDSGLTIIGSDMRSGFGASRLSEILQGAMLDSGLQVTQHIQMNMAAGSTQGQEHIRSGRTANTDFLNMAEHERLKSKHISKENVLKGQNVVRGESIAGATMYAGPSLTVVQKPGGRYVGSDNKIANLDIVAVGWGGARYELTSRLSVQDSPNSGAVVVSAIRFCKVAAELGVVGYLRGASAWTQKTPPVQMKTQDSKFECDALARRVLTPMTTAQLKSNSPKAVDLPWTFADSKSDYE